MEVNDIQAEIDALHRRVFPADHLTNPTPNGHQPTIALSDIAVIERASAASNGDRFRRLFDGDATGYDSRSEADLALCSMLFFWTGDRARVAQLFQQSGLYRDKWDREDYRARTLDTACVGDTYSGGLTGGTGMTGDTEQDNKPTTAARLVQLAGDCDLWHTPEGDAYATVIVKEHAEHHLIGTKAFRTWLSGRFYRETDRVANRQAMQDALDVLEAKATHDGEGHVAHVRVANLDGNIYLDLCDAEWRVIEVSPSGWRVITDPPVRFRRTKAMRPLPFPSIGGSLDDLRPFLNVTDDDSTWRLLLAWLVHSFNDGVQYVVLCLHGEQGSAKSTTGDVLRRLIDPSTALRLSQPRNEQDLALNARNSRVVYLDNLSSLKVWLSDALCRVLTGAGFAARKLYTDLDEMVFDFHRPVILTGINEVATKPDLLDRSVISYLPLITESRRIPETEFWERFEQASPTIFGALLDVLSGVLKELPHVALDRYPRMAEFARTGVALERVMGWPEGSFLAAYTGSRTDADDAVLENYPIAPLLLRLNVPWTGTATELLDILKPMVDDTAHRDERWPKDPARLGGQLREIAPNLRNKGVDISWGKSNKRRISLTRIPTQPTVRAALPSSDNSEPRDGADSSQDSTDASQTVDDLDTELAVPHRAPRQTGDIRNRSSGMGGMDSKNQLQSRQGAGRVQLRV